MEKKSVVLEEPENNAERNPLESTIKKPRYSLFDVWIISSTIIGSTFGISIWGYGIINDMRNNLTTLDKELNTYIAGQNNLNSSLEKNLADIESDIKEIKSVIFVPKGDFTDKKNIKNGD